MSNVVRIPRDGQGAAPVQPRDASALETEMLDAADREAQQLIAATREQIRTILLKARQDLVALRGQIEAGHHHVRGADTHSRHLVREIAGSLRPETQALDREIAAIQQTVFHYREEVAHAPLLSEPEPSPGIADTVSLGPSRRHLVVAAVVVLLVATTGVAALRWWMHRPSLSASAASTTSVAAVSTPATPAREQGRRQMTAGVASHLVLEALHPVWVRVRADSTNEPGQTLAAGERRTISGNRISIRAGNAGALRVSVDGGAFEAFGREGQPLTRDFGKTPDASPRRGDSAPATTVSVNRGAPATVAPKVVSTKTSPPAVAPTVASSPVPVSPASAPATRPGNSAPPPPNTTAAQPAAAPQPAQASAAAAPEVEIVRDAEGWLTAFFNRDQAGMTRIGGAATVVDDQRGAADRAPAGTVLRRSLEQVRVQLVNSSALYTARLIETPQDGGTPFVSLISQVWLRSGTTWQMLSVRVMPEAKVRATLH